VRAVEPGLVWDLGCNDGTYSRLAAAEGAYVVAVDGDHAVVDRLAREENENLLPLVVDLADPSPSLGWRGAERRHLPARGRPDLTLALALVHHLAITRNVPLAELLDWFASLGGTPGFFVVRGSKPVDIVVFAIVVALVPPALLVGLEALVALASTTAERALHLAIVATLAAAVAVQLVRKESHATLLVFAAA